MYENIEKEKKRKVQMEKKTWKKILKVSLHPPPTSLPTAYEKWWHNSMGS